MNIPTLILNKLKNIKKTAHEIEANNMTEVYSEPNQISIIKFFSKNSEGQTLYYFCNLRLDQMNDCAMNTSLGECSFEFEEKDKILGRIGHMFLLVLY